MSDVALIRDHGLPCPYPKQNITDDAKLAEDLAMTKVTW